MTVCAATAVFRPVGNLQAVRQLNRLSRDQRRAMETVSKVLPFRSNEYVIDELIDWSAAPDDPIFQLTFPQPGMLTAAHHQSVERAQATGSQAELDEVVRRIRLELNPHPAGQLKHNVPSLDGERIPGVQHKYRETCLVFPSPGQTCHAYCSFCFRWAQFVGMNELKLATDESNRFCEYLRRHTEVTDVLFTGGDPMVMRTSVLARYLEPLLGPDFDHVQTIRIGSKAISYWPYRFVTDKDADELMRLFERIVDSGKNLAFMAHVNHGRELSTEIAKLAIMRIQATGAVIRTQSPVIRHINDDVDVWSTMWSEQVRLGCVPYYMFVERQTGAKQYFSVPLHRAFEVYSAAMSQLSGLARTARGPVMSALPGKVQINGVEPIAGTDRYRYSLSFVQARNADWCFRPFDAVGNANAEWLTDLLPVNGAREFFFESELKSLLEEPRLITPTEATASMPTLTVLER